MHLCVFTARAVSGVLTNASGRVKADTYPFQDKGPCCTPDNHDAGRPPEIPVFGMTGSNYKLMIIINVSYETSITVKVPKRRHGKEKQNQNKIETTKYLVKFTTFRMNSESQMNEMQSAEKPSKKAPRGTPAPRGILVPQSAPSKGPVHW